MKTVIIGAGAIGGTLAAYATRSGHEVTVIDSNAEHVQAIRDQGIRIGGRADLLVELDVREPNQLDHGYDTAVLATSLSGLSGVLTYVAPHLVTSGCVVTLQNGLAALAAAARLGADRVLPGCVSFAGVLDGPGTIRLASNGPVHIGEFDGPVSARVAAVVDLLGAFDSVRADDNVWGFIWAKLAIAAGFVALALDGRPNVEIYSDPSQRDPLCAVYAEVATIAQSSGVNLEPIKGIYLGPLKRWPHVPPGYHDELFDALLTAARTGAAQKPYSGIRESMLAGRPTEAYSLLEPVIVQADRIGAPATRLRNLLAALRRIEDGHDAAAPELLRATLVGISIGGTS